MIRRPTRRLMDGTVGWMGQRDGREGKYGTNELRAVASSSMGSVVALLAWLMVTDTLMVELRERINGCLVWVHQHSPSQIITPFNHIRSYIMQLIF